MTRQIEQTLNLPRLDETIKDFSTTSGKKADKMAAAFEKMSAQAERLDEGIEGHCREMDELYKQALKAHKDMLDLGFNVEARHAGNIFEPAARFLEIAMNASKSKSEQKLKTLKLRLERDKFNHEKGDTQQGVIDANDASSFIADRNDLLRDLVGRMKDAKVQKR